MHYLCSSIYLPAFFYLCPDLCYLTLESLTKVTGKAQESLSFQGAEANAQSRAVVHTRAMKSHFWNCGQLSDHTPPVSLSCWISRRLSIKSILRPHGYYLHFGCHHCLSGHCRLLADLHAPDSSSIDPLTTHLPAWLSQDANEKWQSLHLNPSVALCHHPRPNLPNLPHYKKNQWGH